MITKSASPTTYNAAGQTITYTIVATNDGNVTLSSVTVTDTPALDGFSCVPANGSSLAPGQSMTCTGTHTITQADVDLGHFDDTACVAAPPAAQACAPNTVTGQQNPHLMITKSASPTTYNAAGQTITYTIVATNDGNVTLSNVTVTDTPALDGFTRVPPNGSNSLAPGQSMTCTGTHTITQADVDLGHFDDTACVTAPPATQACAPNTVTGNQNPALTIDKTSTTTLITAANQVVPYSYVVTNVGNVTLTGVTLTDDKVATLVCNPAQPATLAPGAQMTCTGSHTVTQAEFDGGGNLVNIATADSDQTGPSTDTVTIPIQPPPTKGHIFHTGVTCANFLSNNPSDELASGDYSVKSGKVNQVNPGVMFYYISITAPSSSFTINVTQSNNASPVWKPIPVQATNQIILYNADCSKSNTGTSSVNTTNGTATITVSGATAGATYIVGVKYSLSGLSGQPVSSPFPTVTYSFATNFNGGSDLPSSGDTIVLSPKP
jgi:uncharacterized repeat protein (TIGR01451 family)